MDVKHLADPTRPDPQVFENLLTQPAGWVMTRTGCPCQYILEKSSGVANYGAEIHILGTKVQQGDLAEAPFGLDTYE